ncbi:NmrA family transcriptional regulator [Sphingomonas oleivorans]|uniref:NmrA family transcriptional regulator n=1 Tax=Sphingomonas oleivorans TaxID=1735121 RepID=A0A2T5FZ41_9SPHN|nr:NAD(P)H-binding protein [Sphingomonas oleivorans]PTQ11874.1 NmrA family transcriptional regulator [Sphingomonas oleivorans]
MKIAVIGGTGLVGRKLVSRLRQAAHEVVVAARSTGVDLVGNYGLNEALDGAKVVVDVSNSGYANVEGMQAFFEQAGANLLAAARKAEVAHLIALSAVGANLLDSGFYRAKRTREELISASGMPFTILRSTPLFEFIHHIVDAGGEGDLIRLPPVSMQPVAADDVARLLADIVADRPANQIIEIAGPDYVGLPELALEILAANEDMRRIIVDPAAFYLGARFDREPLTGGDHPMLASTGFEAWLRDWIASA